MDLRSEEARFREIERERERRREREKGRGRRKQGWPCLVALAGACCRKLQGETGGWEEDTREGVRMGD